jgi:hypothetical protein
MLPEEREAGRTRQSEILEPVIVFRWSYEGVLGPNFLHAGPQNVCRGSNLRPPTGDALSAH